MHVIKQAEQKRHYSLPEAEAARMMEAIRMGEYATTKHLSFCMGMAQEYGCRPLESDKQNFYRFLCTIYRYGQVQGIRYLMCSLYASVQSIEISPFLPQRPLKK